MKNHKDLNGGSNGMHPYANILSSPDMALPSLLIGGEGEDYMKAIQTKYNGYKFRSRTEARWAFFLDEVYIHYEYEKEGFSLSDGSAYLPDFYLPDLHTWLEIKGDDPTEPELNKCRLLHLESKKRVVLIKGIPDPNTSHFYTFDRHGEHHYIPAKYLVRYLNDIIEDEIKDNFTQEEIGRFFKNGEELTSEILEDIKDGIRFKVDHINKIQRIRLKKSYSAVSKLINQENEYEGDEYAFGQAKSARFGGVA